MISLLHHAPTAPICLFTLRLDTYLLAMNLLELPNEILVMIVQQLDLKTKISVATTCQRLASVMCCPELIGRVSFSRTAFAVLILQHETFRILAPHIRYLDLCNVGNLDKTWLVPTLELMRNLRSLDLSLTNITLLDLAGVCELCPHLTSLSINYPYPDCEILKLENVEALKRSFRRLENVHLFGDLKSFQSLNAIRIFQDSNLKEYTLTTINSVWYYNPDHEHYDSSFEEFPFKIFSAYFNEIFNVPLYSIPIIEGLFKRRGWDFVLINNSKIIVSSEFFKFKESKTFFGSSSLSDFKICGNVYLFMWHPDVARHNVDFRRIVLNILSRRIDKFVCTRDCKPPFKSIDDSHIYISPNNFCEYIIRYPDDQIPCKHPEYYSLLNIDRFGKFGDDLKLSFIRMGCHIYPGIYFPLTIGPNTDIYRNIVYLHFDPEIERYLSTDFLSDLFKHCLRLETLFYVNDVKHLENSLIYSKSLKHLMIYDRISKPKSFVKALSKCRSLEMIHICDGSFTDEIGHMKHFTEGLSELVESCSCLYNLEYHAVWSKNARKMQMMSIIKVLKETGRDVRCVLADYDRDWLLYKCYIRFDPFCRVFLGHDWLKLITNERLKLIL